MKPPWMTGDARRDAMTKMHVAAELDDVNVDWKLLGYVTDDPSLRRVLFGETADLALVDIVPWNALLVGAL